MASVHSTSVIAASAELGEGVVVGPYAVVGERVMVGARTRLHAHAAVMADTVLGEDNTVHPFAVLGGDPQDRRWKGGSSKLVVGNANVFREHVTVNRGTERGGSVTKIGDRGWYLASCHVAHDCIVGDDVTFANGTLLGGHVRVEDHVVTGGAVCVAPFARIGACAFLAGGAMVERDVPPFVIAAGDRARVRALNVVGLERADVPPASRRALAGAFRDIFRGALGSRADRAARLVASSDPYVAALAAFVAGLKDAGALADTT